MLLSLLFFSSAPVSVIVESFLLRPTQPDNSNKIFYFNQRPNRIHPSSSTIIRTNTRAATILRNEQQWYSSSSSSQPTKKRKKSFYNTKSNENKNNDKNRKRRRDQLHRVIQSIEYYREEGEGSSTTKVPSELLATLKLLQSAKTQKDVIDVGRQLEKHLFLKPKNNKNDTNNSTGITTLSFGIQERIMKATALAGLFSISTELLTRMTTQGYLPSVVSYVALCNALRHAKRKDQLRTVLLQLSMTAKNNNATIDIVAWNTYLAAICQSVENLSSSSSPKKQRKQQEYVYLEKLVNHWLIKAKKEDENCNDGGSMGGLLLPNAPPDLASYNTLLHTAARIGDRSLVYTIWDDLSQTATNQGSDDDNDNVNKDEKPPTIVQPDVRSYNALLQVTPIVERLAVFDAQFLSSLVAPDRFTIDIMLVPLIRAGRIGDLEALLDEFCKYNSEAVVKQAFSAYLVTLCQKGEVNSARALFETYVVPSLTKLSDDDHGNTLPVSIRPDIRHFNILIDGYRRLAESSSTSLDSEDSESEEGQGRNSRDGRKDERQDDRKKKERLAQLEGRKLFRLMKDSGIAPDAYTVTSMMGLCRSCKELHQLLMMATNNNSKEQLMTPAVVRAAISACGRLGDPSSALCLFEKYASTSMNARVWNVLLGALSDGAKHHYFVKNIRGDDKHPIVLDMASCIFDDEKREGMGGGERDWVSRALNGLSCTDAVLEILNIMRGYSSDGILAPFPNSQTYCVAASALQYSKKKPSDPDLAMALFRNATYEGVPADGRFVNAIFRCFGHDIDSAIACWKNEIRKACLAHESRTRNAPVSIHRSMKKNLIAAYNGLLYVCGRALRPDIAVRLAYAMNREGIEPNEVSLNNYLSGKRLQIIIDKSINGEDFGDNGSYNKDKPKGYFARRSMPKLLPKINMVDQYENLLYVECTKYDKYNKRMSKDKRVRIIV